VVVVVVVMLVVVIAVLVVTVVVRVVAGIDERLCASGPPLSETCVPTLSPADLDVACAFGAPYWLVKGCGGFDELILSGVDSGEIHYFDTTSGELIAVVTYDASFGGSVTCLGGPTDFVAPSCLAAPQQWACPRSDASDSKSGPPDANDGSSGDAGGLDP